MTVTLNLTPEIEAGLIAKAQASGMALEEYVLSLVQREALPAQGTLSAREEAIHRMLDFGDRYRLTLTEPVTRELLHEGHRL